MPDKTLLIQSEIPSLHRHAATLTRNREAAEDLVQDCLVRALERMDRWQAGTNMRAWLFTILYRLFLNSRRRPALLSVEDLPPAQSTIAIPSRQMDRARLSEVQNAFARLSKDHREVLHLVAVEHLEYGEAAAILGIAVGTVRSRLFRARAALDGLMETGDDVSLGGAAGMRPTVH